ncbi:serpin family protein [Lentzea tibetensis]|uniref:Serpin family protein n=1 Tax=Lentzea tibetensis TaxID=2591470 RepID=A0A563EH27_9PSEU|nr:serpin family protein [Lentzea tibetensis]TWP45801.1 serpin family protein [Lentzea tibetensis]
MIEFAARLHRELPGDVCWSPYSVAAALHTVLGLVRGETRDELLELLGSAGLPGSHPPDFAVADALWARRGMNLPPPVQFFDDPVIARKLINADVAAVTRDLIPELIDDLPLDTVSVLVNALYLKASWAEEFTAAGPLPFTTPDGEVDVPSMSVEERLGYARLHGWQVVTIPALGDVEAVVLMPKQSLDLNPALFATLLAAPQPTNVRLRMPKLEYGAELLEPLAALGVTGMFVTGPDFPDPTMTVDSVVHRTVLRVDEHGLEGAAGTAMVAVMGWDDFPDPVVVKVDRPFLFVVRHARTGAIYFMARVSRPASS